MADSLPMATDEGVAAHSPPASTSITRVFIQNQSELQLPPELLLEVLKLACLDDGETSCYYSTRAILLSAVCSYWRKTMLEDPSLWTQILFEGTEGSFKLGLLCLERSQGHLVDLTVHAYDLDNIKALSSHSHRIRTLSIRTPERNCIALMLGFLPNKISLSSLRNIWVDYTGVEDNNDLVSGGLCPGFLLHGGCWKMELAILSSLHTLKLHGVRFGKYPAQFSFDQLQTLELGRGCSIGDFRSILSTARNLRIVKLYRLLFNYSSSAVPPHAMLTFPPSLKKLTLSGIQNRILDVLIKCIPPGDYELVLELIAQNMIPTMLQETTGQGGPDEYINRLTNIFRDAHAISTLVIDTSHYLNSAHIRTLLACMLHTHALVLKKLHLDKEQLLAMTAPHLHSVPNTPASLFPTFSRLEFHECKIADAEAFYALITSHPIKELFIYRSLLLQDEEYMEIRSSSSFPRSTANRLSDAVPNFSCTISN